MTRFSFVAFFIGIVSIAAFAQSVAWAGPLPVRGLDFSPYIDGQAPPDNVPIAQSQARLDIVAPHTQWVRTFGARSGLENIPALARNMGLNVAMGAFVNADNTNNQIQKDNLIAQAVAGNVDVAIVGNETLVFGALSEAQLLAEMQDVRQQLDNAGLANIPVTTAEPYGDFVNAQPGSLFKRDANGNLIHATVFQAMDVVFVNLYPFHEGTNIDNAVTKLAQMYQDVVNTVNEVSPGKQVIISETGWPSAGQAKNQAVPSPENAARYYNEAVAWAAANNVDLFYFEAFDENWKGPDESEKHFGIWDAAGNLKPTFDSGLLLSGDYDLNGIVDAKDIDLLFAEVNDGTNDPFFELTGDALVDQADVDELVQVILGTVFGDANLDGSVTVSDFATLQSNIGQVGGWADGDFNGDGIVSVADFAVIQSNFGQSGVGAPVAIPEPTSLVLMGISGLMMGLRCWR